MAKFILHEKADIGRQVALCLKNYATRLKNEAKQFDCKWPFSIAKDMEEMSEYYLNMLK